MTDFEKKIENEIVEKGLIALRLTPAKIDTLIVKEEYHVFESSNLTVCCLTLQNDFVVVGESACISAANYDLKLGRKISKKNARKKIWQLESYLLKQQLHDNKV